MNLHRPSEKRPSSLTMTPSPPPRKLWIATLLLALFGSGVASIINQVVWQRALKIYLAGSEAVSAMIVVLVFMLGLGVGSQLMGKRAPPDCQSPAGLCLD